MKEFDKDLSRRDFLKIAGVTGATIGVAGGLGGLVARAAARRRPPRPQPGGDTTTTAAPGGDTTTSVSADVETGREIR